MSRLFVALLAAALLSAAHAADPAKQKSDFQRQLDSVKSLSAALQRDKAAATPAGKETLAVVEARQKEAEGLAAAGEYEVAGTVLDEAYKKLTATLAKAKAGAPTPAAASADGKPLANGKAKEDFERKLASATALLDAEKRVDSAAGNRHQADIASLESGVGKAKAAAAAGDFALAHRLIDEVLANEKRLITSTKKNDPATAGLKSGSASLEREAAAPAAGADAKAELARTLHSTTSLRDLLARRSKEGGVDRSAALGKIDQQLGEARRLESSDPKRALQVASDAYAAAKTEVEKLQAK